MICFHGTTEKSLNAILNGLDKKGENLSAWSVSEDDGAFYCYPMKKIDGDCIEERTAEGIRSAFSNAAITAAVNGSSKMYVIEFKVNGGLLEDDYSCENMSDIASFISLDDLNKIQVLKIYECSFNQYLAAFAIASLLDNVNFNIGEIDQGLIEAAESIAENGCDIPECLYEFDYSEVFINKELAA